MNRAYRLLWSEITGTWVAVAEIARSSGKRASGALLLAAIGEIAFAAPPAVTELPTGGQVVAGQAAIAQSGARMDINQTSQRAAIDWQTFNVGSQAHVNFNQPSSSSVTLNRVLDTQASQIFGRITANGQVFLTNPNGVYFSRGASVDVGALVATTHGISNADFMAGRNVFNRNGATGSIINEGEIKAALGGYIALLAPEVRNQGLVIAQMGTVALAAGEAYELQFDSNNTLANLRVTPATIQTLVDNGNAVKAPGGLIILSAQATNQIQGSVVNNTGNIEATGMTQHGGRIFLDAGEGGQATVSGQLNASSANANGGQIVVTGEKVLVTSTAHLNASGTSGGGEVLVGGSWQGQDVTIRQAVGTIVEGGAVLEASATDHGNGGTVVAWSDISNPLSVTRAYGTFSAKGGPRGGDGGRIETSGYWLDTRGIIANASAPNGKSGVWLLDPNNIVINASATIAGPSFPNWTATADSSNILNTDINAQLNGGTSVTIATGTGGANAQEGHITVNSAIGKTAGGDATLTLQAARNIYINNDITATTGKLNVVLNSNRTGVNGSVSVFQNRTISSNGGNITIGGGADPTTGNAVGNNLVEVFSVSSGPVDARRGITINGTLSAGGGDILLRGQGLTAGGRGVSIGGSITTTGTGNISIDGTATSTSAGIGMGDSTYYDSTGNTNPTGATLNGVISAQNGTITLTGNKSSGTNGVDLSNSGSSITTSGSGNLVLVSNGAINGTGSFSVGGITNLTAASGSNITLTNTSNNFTGGVRVVSGNNVSITDTNALVLGNANGASTISGTLTAVAGGAVTQAGALSVTSTTSLTAGSNEITLTNTSNDFTGNLSVVSAAAVSIKDANALSLGASAASGDFTAEALSGNLTIAGSFTKSSGADATASFKASGRVIQNSSVAISSTNNKLNVVHNSDTGAADGGGISLASGASITTNGGNFTAGGGANPATSFAVGSGSSTYTPQQFGFYTDGNNTINAGGGNISIRGKSISTQTANGVGLGWQGTTSITTTAAGTISIVGDTPNTGAYEGINIGNGGVVTIDGGTLNFTGTSAGGFNPIRIAGSSQIGATLAQSITFDSNYTGSSSTGWTIIFGTNGGTTPVTVGNTTNTSLIDFIVDRSGTAGSYGAVNAFANGLAFKGNGAATLKFRPSANYLTNGQTIGGNSDGNNWTLQLSTSAGSNSNLAGFLSALTGATGFSEIQAGRSDGSGASLAYYTSSALNQNLKILSGSGGLTFSNAAGGTFNTGSGNLSVSSAGAIAVNNTVSTTGTLTLSPTTTASESSAGAINAANLVVTAAGTMTFSGIQSITGTTDLTAGAGNNISMTNASNNFAGGVRVVSANNVSITDSNALVLGNANGTTTFSGNLTAVANGAITQAGGLLVTGTTDLTAGSANNITLTTASNNFTGGVRVGSGNNVSITDTNALVLGNANGDSTISGNLTAIASGAITQAGQLLVTGSTDLTAGAANNITLTTATNNFIGGVRVVSGNNVSLRDTNAMVLGNANGDTTVSGNLTAVASGAITQAGKLLITGTTGLTAGTGNAITLTTTTNDFGGALSVVSGGSIAVIDANALTLGAVDASGLIDVASLVGDLTLTGNITTSNTTASAIKLNAGKTANAGTSTGGNILVTGSPTVTPGSGGFATLYTGSITGSTGLAALIGATSGRFRYNSDETASNFTVALTAGTNAVYRESEAVTTTTTTTTTSAPPVPLLPVIAPPSLPPVLNIPPSVEPPPAPPPAADPIQLIQPEAPTPTVSSASTVSAPPTGTPPTTGTGLDTPAAPAIALALFQPNPVTQPQINPPLPATQPAPLSAPTISAIELPTSINLPQPTSSPLLTAPAFKAAVTSLQQGLSGGDGGGTPSSASPGNPSPTGILTSLVNSQVDTAIARGLPVAQAEQAGKQFNQALVQNLSKGMPMSEAVVAAERVFQAEASFPQPTSAQEAAVKSVTTSGVDVDAKLTTLANTKTSGGTAAFEKSLGVALLKGMSFDQAVKSAQQAGQRMDAMAQADRSPKSALAGGGDAAEQFSDTSPSFQKTLSSLLAKGLPLNEATSKANAASRNSARTARADKGSPMSGLASGDLSMLDGMPLEGAFGKVLSVTLAKGVPIADAMGRANQANAVEDQGTKADARSQFTGFSGGKGALPVGNPDFDRALASAIGRGESPTKAIATARQTVERMPKDVQNASTSLASGKGVDALLSSPGNSRAFKLALGNALAKGMPVDKAIALATKAEAASAFKFPLSGQAARMAAGKGGKMQITMADGKPLPSWLRYAPETKSFVASDVPEGAFPLPVVLSLGGQQAKLTITEGAIKK